MSNEWPIVALGDIFAIARGGSPRPIQEFITDDPDGVNWITISDATESSKHISSTRRRITKAGVSRSRMVHPGDFLLTNSMSFGRPYIMNTSGCIHDGWLVFGNREQRVDSDYFFHLLGSATVYSEFERLAAGVTVKNLNIDLVKKVCVPLPPLAEQQRIAKVLDAADALRAKRRASIGQLEGLPSAIFIDVFGDPGTNPKGWQTAKFETTCERVTVGIVVQPASYYVDSGVPALRSLNIKPGNISLDDLVYFSTSDNETKLSKTRLKSGDVVLVRSGRPGTAAVVPDELDGINAIDILIASPSRKLIDPTYICAFFNSPEGRRLVLSEQRGQIQKHLNVGSLNDVDIPLPPLPLQQEFARRIAAVERLKSAHRASLAELDALFASLQHRAFRGEL